MDTMIRRLMLSAVIALMVVPKMSPAQIAGIVGSIAKSNFTDQWDAIARDHIRPGQIGRVSLNLVDYKAISADPRWPVLLGDLEKAAVPGRRPDRIAFWANAYNILAINTVLEKYPVKSIKDVGSLFQEVWDRDAGVVAGKMRTLNEIEHKILRPMGEPRIHAAIVCASVSCPPLRAEAFRGARLNEQLDEQMRVWLANDQVGTKVEKNGAAIRISSIFKWFGEDFEKDGNTVRKTLEKYLSATTKAALKPEAAISYLDYDWTLNDTKRSK